jgi:hypothetical protein
VSGKGRDCPHGQLARVCERCELEAANAHLRQLLTQCLTELDRATRGRPMRVSELFAIEAARSALGMEEP